MSPARILDRLLGVLPPRLRHWVEANLMVIGLSLPNLAVTAPTLFILGSVFHWKDPLAAWVVATVFSVQVSVFVSRRLKTRLQGFGREFSFAHVEAGIAKQGEFVQMVGGDRPERVRGEGEKVRSQHPQEPPVEPEPDPHGPIEQHAAGELRDLQRYESIGGQHVAVEGGLERKVEDASKEP